MTVKSLQLALSMMLLVGCQAQQPIRDLSSPYYAPPTGTIITVHNHIKIPPEQSQAYIQQGQSRNVQDTNLYSPFLWVLIDPFAE